MRSERILENGVSLVRFFLLLLVLLLQAVEWRGGKPIPTYFLLAGELLLHDSSWSVILLKQNAFFISLPLAIMAPLFPRTVKPRSVSPVDLPWLAY